MSIGLMIGGLVALFSVSTYLLPTMGAGLTIGVLMAASESASEAV